MTKYLGEWDHLGSCWTNLIFEVGYVTVLEGTFIPGVASFAGRAQFLFISWCFMHSCEEVGLAESTLVVELKEGWLLWFNKCYTHSFVMNL